MRRIFLFLLPVCLLAKSPSNRALEAISPDAAKFLISYLAADSMMGRNTPSPELDRSADFLATQFQEIGLQPVNGSYFQQVRMNRVHLGDTNTVTLFTPQAGQKTLEIKKDFMPFETTARGQAQAEVVFVGYGISSPEHNYDDYSGIDVKGKIVLALKGGPNDQKADSPFSPQKRLPAIKLNEKVAVAIARGAVGFMLVTNPLRSSLLKPAGFPWPNLFKGFPADAVPTILAHEEKERIPCVQVGEEALKSFFGSVDSCKALAQRIDSLYQPHSMALSGHRVDLHTSIKIRTEISRNVVALLPGADEVLKDELIIVGAHYDHVGVKKNVPAGQDSINNGADDNASGTAGVVLTAAAFAKEKEPPARSVLFIAFAGEERGLYGSETYVANPLFPLEKTVAMINMDMIGRNKVDSLTIYGRSNAPELWDIAAKENKHIKFRLSPGLVKESGGSDHTPFNKKKIPTLFFHTGLHSDYHNVGDEAGKISYGKLALAARLCYRTVWQLANSSFRPLLHEAKNL